MGLFTMLWVAKFLLVCWCLFGAGQSIAGTAPGGDIIGLTSYHLTTENDTFTALAQRYRVGYVELRAANPALDPWVPGADRLVAVPTAHILPDGPRHGIVLNLGDLRLYQFTDDGKVRSYPIGIGRDITPTPIGETRVIRKQTNPYWFPPKSIRLEKPDLPNAVPPGPNNPLGIHALYLDFDAYLIHGTNRQAGVGRRVSHGCIRMYRDDIKDLYERVVIGTTVTIIQQYVKLGWVRDDLYIEVHPIEGEVDAVEASGKAPLLSDIEVVSRIIEKVEGQETKINWRVVADSLQERTGLPTLITQYTAYPLLD